MTGALRDGRTGWMLPAAMAVSGAAWWWLLAGPSTGQVSVCGIDGLGPVGGAWSAGRLAGLSGMWVAMSAAMIGPVGAATFLCSGRGEDARRADEGAMLRVRLPLIRSYGPPSPRGKKRQREAPFSFLRGYLAFFIAISIAAAVGQWTLESLNLIGENAKIASPFLAGTILALSGLWHVAQMFRRPAPCGSPDNHHTTGLRRGWQHGCSSLSCCLTMIGLQLVVGAMNAWLMIGLTLWMLAETLLPWKRELASATGIALLTAGGLTIAGAFG